MKVLYFAQRKSASGCDEDEVRLPSECGSAGVWEAILARHPSLERWRLVARLARNGEYAMPDTRFTDADEVVMIPPVSGG